MKPTRSQLHLAEKHAEVVREASDAETLQAIQRGDLGALGVLFDRHAGAVRRFVLRASGSNAAEVDDVVQETFLVIPRVAGNYDGRASARPFLMGIAAQLLRRRNRRLGRVARLLRELASLPTKHVRTPEEAASEQESVAILNRALARVSEEKRMVFLLVEGEGLSGEEVAGALGIPVATVWTRLHYVRLALRESLHRRERS